MKKTIEDFLAARATRPPPYPIGTKLVQIATKLSYVMYYVIILS